MIKELKTLIGDYMKNNSAGVWVIVIVVASFCYIAFEIISK
jgi:hypothetical protein